MTNHSDTRWLEATATKDPTTGARCLSRRVWDWSRAWRDTLVHLVWFWRIGVVLAMAAVGVYAWNAPEVGPRAIATTVLFGLVILLALDLFTAIFNLPLLAFYALVWCLLSLTSLVDMFVYARHLGAVQNRIAVLVLFANFTLGIGAMLWWSLER